MSSLAKIDPKSQDSLWNQIEAANNGVNLLNQKQEISNIYSNLISIDVTDKTDVIAKSLNQLQNAKIDQIVDTKLDALKTVQMAKKIRECELLHKNLTSVYSAACDAQKEWCQEFPYKPLLNQDNVKRILVSSSPLIIEIAHLLLKKIHISALSFFLKHIEIQLSHPTMSTPLPLGIGLLPLGIGLFFKVSPILNFAHSIAPLTIGASKLLPINELYKAVNELFRSYTLSNKYHALESEYKSLSNEYAKTCQ